MKIFVSGGCKNGKSTFAQKEAESIFKREKEAGRADTLYYLATMDPVDGEDRARIQRHIEERKGKGYVTEEQPRDICHVADVRGVFLLDSVTALLSNEMFGRDGSFNIEAAEKVKDDLLRFGSQVAGVVYVSDYIYGDGTDGLDFSREYMKGLAGIDRALAAGCEKVFEVTYGNVVTFK